MTTTFNKVKEAFPLRSITYSLKKGKMYEGTIGMNEEVLWKMSCQNMLWDVQRDEIEEIYLYFANEKANMFYTAYLDKTLSFIPSKYGHTNKIGDFSDDDIKDYIITSIRHNLRDAAIRFLPYTESSTETDEDIKIQKDFDSMWKQQQEADKIIKKYFA